MAIGTVIQLVKERLPFIPNDNTYDARIESLKLEVYYALQHCTKLTDAEVEDDSKYTGLRRFLVARYVCYLLIYNKIIEVVGGVGGSAPSGNKRIKKGKADVVEAEFDYAKASDGTTLTMEATNLMNGLLKEICSYASTLKCSLPLCSGIIKSKGYGPAFIAYGGTSNICGCGSSSNPQNDY
ncbi:MAG TPA: hypothetical protein PLJ18_11525 [Niabella sp.]|nr:hypothetical protein [Bacteroidia bacterium]HOZ90989.1 hypothetical protein [Bacteroidia bacterium]HRB52088.1 hypothetical protein [Bacteroidia bacterium]HRC03076.1 hypothetical protein [Niabella sp.]